MKKGKKPNANEAQIRAARNEGSDKTMVFAMTALSDKMGFDREQLLEFIRAVAYVSQSVVKGYVKYEDLHRVLVEEKDLDW